MGATDRRKCEEEENTSNVPVTLIHFINKETEHIVLIDFQSRNL
jgi:hypothetical protein